MRSWLPGPIGGILWFGVDDAASSVYFPVYAGVTDVPHAYRQGTGGYHDVTFDAAFWVFNLVANYAYTRYNIIHPEIRAKQTEMEWNFLQETKEIDAKAAELVKTDPEGAVAMLTDYSVKAGN